jgi:hydroxymethylbilane synthase
MRERFLIGTRGSDLALWQANFVKTSLEGHFPGIEFAIKIIRTTGDDVIDVALSKIGDKGLFTRQIEAELLEGGIDLAVHSLKDLQTAHTPGLALGAVCERELPNDAFISNRYSSLDDLPRGAKVATGSLRRKCQLLNYRPDLQIVEIRGNVPTRLKKFDEAGLDAMILAYAGLHRLGLDERVRQLIPESVMLPAVGQGAVAIELRSDDADSHEIASKLDDHATRACSTAERAFLRRLEGGCQVPIGALAKLEGDRLALEGMVGDLDGTTVLRECVEGGAADAEEIGLRLAETLIEKGATDMLTRTRAAAAAAEPVL